MYDSRKHHRRSIRLQHWDYASNGIYFVTICVEDRRCLLGEIVDSEMVLSDIGRLVQKQWLWLEENFTTVALDAHTMMPNHMHGILSITDDINVTKQKSLGAIIGAFKTTTTKQLRVNFDIGSGKFWQRNYYEHIIRNEKSLLARREYIKANPSRWTDDQLYSTTQR